mmetsp:Transcript_24668/g.49455  ORF Transcript_24668/g.49455 Transcript_24668/m.49455 type:complete len:80 (-) Transcript_24668:765-1004(-)
MQKASLGSLSHSLRRHARPRHAPPSKYTICTADWPIHATTDGKLPACILPACSLPKAMHAPPSILAAAELTTLSSGHEN